MGSSRRRTWWYSSYALAISRIRAASAGGSDHAAGGATPGGGEPVPDQGPRPRSVRALLPPLDPLEDLRPDLRREIAVPGDFCALLEEEQAGTGGGQAPGRFENPREGSGVDRVRHRRSGALRGRGEGPRVLLQALPGDLDGAGEGLPHPAADPRL